MLRDKRVTITELKEMGKDQSYKECQSACLASADDIVGEGDSANAIDPGRDKPLEIKPGALSCCHCQTLYVTTSLFSMACRLWDQMMENGFTLDRAVSEPLVNAIKAKYVANVIRDYAKAVGEGYCETCENKSGALEGSNGKIAHPSTVCRISPISMAKAVKNNAELEGMHSSHLRDPSALSKFWAWLEEEIHENVVLIEVEVADKLLEFRAKQYGFLDTSFDTISGEERVKRMDGKYGLGRV
ncbi:hypothetical protein IFM89_017768 [Coptis chinensis]|uniref:Uncharacterized protein n=1 Tax=Coptis chinensis TaxID=261450 RepID=A0A835I2Y8_9MAGN|nr:hypothetical protein IFM89_017768 [Coptis chinensis]